MKDRVNVSEWKNPKAEQKFRTLEDEFWREYWPDPLAPIDVETRLGRTRIYRSEGSGDPVVFLHGVGGTSVTWSGYFDAVDDRTAFAVDTIGDLGRSVQRVPVNDPTDLAEWLVDVFDALGIERAHLVGTSYGGFLALNLAARAPNRVTSIAVFEPAGVVPVRFARFLVWGFAVGLSSLMPRRGREIAARKLRMPVIEDKGMMRMVRLGQFGFRRRALRPPPLSDEQLSSISVPVLLMVGENSEVFPPSEVRDRGVALLGNVDAEVVAGAGHALAMSHREHVVARLTGFLEHQRFSPPR